MGLVSPVCALQSFFSHFGPLGLFYCPLPQGVFYDLPGVVASLGGVYGCRGGSSPLVRAGVMTSFGVVLSPPMGICCAPFPYEP